MRSDFSFWPGRRRTPPGCCSRLPTLRLSASGIRNFLHFFSDTLSRQIVARLALPKHWIQVTFCFEHGSLWVPTLGFVRSDFECMWLPHPSPLPSHMCDFWEFQTTSTEIILFFCMPKRWAASFAVQQCTAFHRLRIANPVRHQRKKVS